MDSLTYSTDDGSFYQKAVVIKGAKDETAGIAAERAWLARMYPGFRTGRQSLMAAGGRQYDLIKITTSQGIKSIYFDITDFFGK